VWPVQAEDGDTNRRLVSIEREFNKSGILADIPKDGLPHWRVKRDKQQLRITLTISGWETGKACWRDIDAAAREVTEKELGQIVEIVARHRNRVHVLFDLVGTSDAQEFWNKQPPQDECGNLIPQIMPRADAPHTALAVARVSSVWSSIHRAWRSQFNTAPTPRLMHDTAGEHMWGDAVVYPRIYKDSKTETGSEFRRVEVTMHIKLLDKPDAGEDAGMPDAGEDAGMPDAGEDAGMPDAGMPDAGDMSEPSIGWRLQLGIPGTLVGVMGVAIGAYCLNVSATREEDGTLASQNGLSDLALAAQDEAGDYHAAGAITMIVGVPILAASLVLVIWEIFELTNRPAITAKSGAVTGRWSF